MQPCRSPLRIERDHLVKLAVAFNFLLVLLDGIEQVFQQVTLHGVFPQPSSSRASGDARCEINQCFKLLDLPVACAKRR